MRKQNAQRTTAPQAAEPGKSKSQPDSKPNEPRLCAPMTGIRDDFAEALWAFDHPSSDDEGPAVAAVAPVSNRDENGYLDDAAAYKLCCGPFSDEEEQGPASDQADSLSDSLAEFYSDPLISAAVTASAAVPDKPAEPAAESAAPSKPTSTTNPPAAESAEPADATAVAAAKPKPKGKNKRRSGRSRRRSKSQRRQAKAAAAQAMEEEDVEWPVPVNPDLKPYFSPGAAKRVVDGKYQMTDIEREAFLNRDRTRQSKVVGIDQRNTPATSDCSTTVTPRCSFRSPSWPTAAPTWVFALPRTLLRS
jgi:hypothetical protein